MNEHPSTVPRVALVTGGTVGIGAAICEALLVANYRVAANYADRHAAADAFATRTGIPVFAWDVADLTACADGVERVRRWGRSRCWSTTRASPERNAVNFMQAVVHSVGRPLRIEEVLVPEVTAGQVLVKVVASGVCHTDLHAAEGDWPVKPSLPFIPGHGGRRLRGRARRRGQRHQEGDRVGVPWLQTA
mgnify:CR=1 FL=1